MNLNLRKSMLLVGALATLGLTYTTEALATPPYQMANSVQQSKKVTGNVSDAEGPVIGASVVEKGNPSNGAVTDLDGNFTLNVKPGATIVVTYIGYKTQEIAVGNQSNINVTMQNDDKTLDEVVVVGYGVQKKKLVTGATVQVKGDDIAKMNTTNVLGAMQSQSPGVSIVQSSGQAGDGFKVNIRGIGTTGDSAPLYVIDGVAGGDINSLNPSDIESIDVLKDAASSAIYGARAANGVILVTTKQGKTGKVQVTYDGYVGFQYLAKRPDVLNAKEYMYAQELKAANGGNTAPVWKNVLPENLYDAVMDGSWNGTDWVDASYHKGAVTQNHSVNLLGGNDISKFSVGFAYTNQKGIFGGPEQSGYNRYNARVNSEHIILKKKDFDVIKFGENLTFSYISKNGMGTNANMYSNNMHDIQVANPLLPEYDANGDFYTNNAMSANGWTIGAAANPMAKLAQTNAGLNTSNSWRLNMVAYLEVQPIKNLVWRSQFGYKMNTSSYRSMTQIYNNGSDSATKEEINQNMGTYSSYSFENTLAYTTKFDKHNLNVVVGNTIEKNAFGVKIDGTSHSSKFGSDWDKAYLTNTQPGSITDISLSGEPQSDWSLASFFGRASYNYDEKYMAQFTLRADGSSNFMRGHRWGYFPSASLGWVVTNEKFMESTSSWMDFLKIRASWGQNGNQNISNFQYLTSFDIDNLNGYFFGLGNKTSQTNGAYAKVLKNENVTWETSEQIDLGVDARFLKSRLGLTFDWYQKKTKDWLVQAPIQAVWGVGAPYVNGGDVKNTGVELGLTWNDQIGKDFTYGAGLNLATNKNKVTRIANSEGIIHGPSAVLNQQETEIFRAEVGKPIGYFWGMKTDGVFQNQAQIDEWSKTHTDKLHSTLKPGDLIYVDTTGDGIIDQNDRCEIGNPHPDVTLGFNLHAAYKGFDLAITGNGAFGQQIVRTWDKQESTIANLNKKILYGSWKGEGTSNFLPKLDNMSNVNWQTFSSIWVEDADYVKIQNVTLGYDFKNIWKTCPFSQLRLYVSAQNLFTFTGYSGLDPEVGSDGGTVSWASGIDNGVYPSPRTYMIGVNVKF